MNLEAIEDEACEYLRARYPHFRPVLVLELCAELRLAREASLEIARLTAVVQAWNERERARLSNDMDGASVFDIASIVLQTAWDTCFPPWVKRLASDYRQQLRVNECLRDEAARVVEVAEKHRKSVLALTRRLAVAERSLTKWEAAALPLTAMDDSRLSPVEVDLKRMLLARGEGSGT